MSEHHKKDWSAVRSKDKSLQDESSVNDHASEEELTSGMGHDNESHAIEHPSYVHLEEKLTLAEQKAHENWEKSVRAVAELENVRRRAEREVANAHRYSLEKFATALLPVLDSLEQALQLAGKDENTSMHEGLELTEKLFLDVLKKFDVHAIDPIGELFDPKEHEAMSMQQTADAPQNTILAVFQKGYKLSDRVIRPARVIVAKA